MNGLFRLLLIESYDTEFRQCSTSAMYCASDSRLLHHQIEIGVFLASVIGVKVTSRVIIVDTSVVRRADSGRRLLCSPVVKTAAGRPARRLEDGRGREGGHRERYRSDTARVDHRRRVGSGGGGGGTGRSRKHTAECRRYGRSRRGTPPDVDCIVEFLQ